MKKSKILLLGLPALLLAGCGPEEKGETWSAIDNAAGVQAVKDHLEKFGITASWNEEDKEVDLDIANKGKAITDSLGTKGQFEQVIDKHRVQTMTREGQDPDTGDSHYITKSGYAFDVDKQVVYAKDNDESKTPIHTDEFWYSVIDNKFTGIEKEDDVATKAGEMDVPEDLAKTLKQFYLEGLVDGASAAIYTFAAISVAKNKVSENEGFEYSSYAIGSLIEYARDLTYTYKFQKSNKNRYIVEESVSVTNYGINDATYTYYTGGGGIQLNLDVSCTANVVHKIVFGENLVDEETLTASAHYAGDAFYNEQKMGTVDLNCTDSISFKLLDTVEIPAVPTNYTEGK